AIAERQIECGAAHRVARGIQRRVCECFGEHRRAVVERDNRRRIAIDDRPETTRAASEIEYCLRRAQRCERATREETFARGRNSRPQILLVMPPIRGGAVGVVRDEVGQVNSGLLCCALKLRRRGAHVSTTEPIEPSMCIAPLSWRAAWIGFAIAMVVLASFL